MIAGSRRHHEYLRAIVIVVVDERKNDIVRVIRCICTIVCFIRESDRHLIKIPIYMFVRERRYMSLEVCVC